MRKTALYVLAVLVVLTAVMPAGAAENPQKPGKWKVTLQMEMPGIPVKIPPVTTDVCLTEEDLKDPQKSVPNDPKSDCKIGDYEVDGNSVTWTMTCAKQNMTGTGEITYTDSSYTGSMKMTVGEQEMNTRYSGKWLGACTK